MSSSLTLGLTALPRQGLSLNWKLAIGAKLAGQCELSESTRLHSPKLELPAHAAVGAGNWNQTLMLAR